MEAKPLSKAIYNKAKKLGITQIQLLFSGGNDEGHLNIEVENTGEVDPWDKDFYKEIEDWAWEVYSYSGAGDGSNYGDNIIYDLVKGEVSTEEWYDAPQHHHHEPTKLEVE